MKKILLLLLCLNCLFSFGQTTTAVVDGNWEDVGTWDNGVPQTGYDVVIPTQMEVTMNSGTTITIASLTIGGTNARLKQKTNTALTITGDLSITRSQDGYFFDGGSDETGVLILQGNLINDKRMRITKQLPAENQWHLFSFGFRASRHSEIFSSTTFATNVSNKYSFSTYDGSQAIGSKYVYPFDTSSTFASSDADATTDGKGYSLKTTTGSANVVWRARFHTDNVAIDISDAGDQFNLLGNPYPAYLHANDAADATNNILRINGANGSQVLDEDTIWLWDGTNLAWVTKNLGDAAFRINPMQGFFVKAKSGGGISQSFSFTESMQSNTKTDGFFKSSNNRFEVDLSVAIGKKKTSTSVRYINNTTTDFDNGYDSSTFGGYTSSFEVYTTLLGGDVSKKLAIQSLPKSDYENMVVPVGLSVSPNSEVTFSAKVSNIPAGYKVFLEDRLNNTFTRLDEAGSEYIATVTEAKTEGRFYLHTRSSALSVESEFLNSVSIYKSDAATLRIVGLSQGKSNVKLFNVLGKQVMNASFNAQGVKEIALPKLATGVYIVQLETETGKLNKKIVLE